MFVNPFAEIFKNAFLSDVLKDSIYVPRTKIEHPQRLKTFLDNLNRFFRKSGIPPILYHQYTIDEKKTLEYALFLRGYMRDAQHILANLRKEEAIDKNLIELFDAASQYAVACNGKIGDKRIFDNNAEHRIWKIDLSKGTEKALYYKVQQQINHTDVKTNNERNISYQRKNLFLFMPFRLKDDELTLRKWLYMNMQNTLDNKDIFADKVDTYVVHYPIQKSRSSNIASVLRTIENSQNYYEEHDMNFVKNNWLSFIAKDIKFDGYKVVDFEPFTEQQLSENFRNITIFGYCAAVSSAHRCLNALQNISNQIYGEEVTKKAMQQIFVSSYGFLPLQNNSLYSGVHFYTNAENDTLRKEPFVNLNNHSLYEKTKCLPNSGNARFSVMEDGRNFVVSLKLAKERIILRQHQFNVFKDGEFGHSMNNINSPNINDKDNYAFNLFKSVLENSSLGVRGPEVFNMKKTQATSLIVQNIALRSNIQKL